MNNRITEQTRQVVGSVYRSSFNNKKKKEVISETKSKFKKSENHSFKDIYDSYNKK